MLWGQQIRPTSCPPPPLSFRLGKVPSDSIQNLRFFLKRKVAHRPSSSDVGAGNAAAFPGKDFVVKID